jgi:adenylosuccinate lyase
VHAPVGRIDTLLRAPRAVADMTDDTIAGLSRSDPLAAVSPLDGRYAGRTAPLSPYASEAGLMRARVQVEVEYLIELAALSATPIALDDDAIDALRDLYESFSADDAELIKALEVDGAAGYAATNHDVKAVEYFLRVRLDEWTESPESPLHDAESLHPWIHFGLTSEDVNNLAQRLLVGPAVETVLVPAIRDVRDALVELAHEYRDVPMLARTHGQPATPTTFGKEMAVYAARLGRALGRVADARATLSGKLAGASGTYAAHVAAYPEVDWPSVSRALVERLGLEHVPLATQVNPIDFENSEGNLSVANGDLTLLADYVTSSRLQRDLSDSTVKRTIGAAFAHCLIGYSKTADGLETVVPNEAVMREALESTPAVIGEAVQTILSREGDTEAYERVKELTRGSSVTLGDFHELFAELDVAPSVREELRALTPATYTGIAADLADGVGEPATDTTDADDAS